MHHLACTLSIPHQWLQTNLIILGKIGKNWQPTRWPKFLFCFNILIRFHIICLKSSFRKIFPSSCLTERRISHARFLRNLLHPNKTAHTNYGLTTVHRCIRNLGILLFKHNHLESKLILTHKTILENLVLQVNYIED